MKILTPTCTLRRFLPGDAPTLARHADDRRIWLNLRDAFPHPYSLADAERYIARVAHERRPTSLAIDIGGEAVGSISLRPGADIERYSAELGYWLGVPFWGRGIMTDAVRAATTHGLTSLGMLRIFALPFTRNPASARVLEKAGYTLEGTMRRSAVKDGVVVDQLLYAVVGE